MFRFTIRDSLWLMVVVGLGVALVVSRREWYRVYVDLSIAEQKLETEHWKVEYLLDKYEGKPESVDE